jgi:hypothetical protein
MFLLRLNKRVNPAFVACTSLIVNAYIIALLLGVRAEFYNKIAKSVSNSNALYANGYNDEFRRAKRREIGQAN